jgi:hypothetical protein
MPVVRSSDAGRVLDVVETLAGSLRTNLDAMLALNRAAFWRGVGAAREGTKPESDRRDGIRSRSIQTIENQYRQRSSGDQPPAAIQ